MSAPREALADLLRDFGVDLADPIRRLTKARAMDEAGVAVEDARLVFTHVEAVSKPGSVPGIVSGLALQPERLIAAAPDARAYAAAKEARQRQRDGEADRGFGDPASTPRPVEGSEERAAIIAAGLWREIAWRAQGEARLVEVAQALGLALADARRLIEQGEQVLDSQAAARGKPAYSPKQAARDANEERQRRADFRQRMRSDAVRAAAKRGAPKPIDWDRLKRDQAELLARARATGRVDLAAVLRDRSKRGALATLEADGWLLREGPPDEAQCQPYRVAKDEVERAQFRAQQAVWNQADRTRHDSREPTA